MRSYRGGRCVTIGAKFPHLEGDAWNHAGCFQLPACPPPPAVSDSESHIPSWAPPSWPATGAALVSRVAALQGLGDGVAMPRTWCGLGVLRRRAPPLPSLSALTHGLAPTERCLWS